MVSSIRAHVLLCGEETGQDGGQGHRCGVQECEEAAAQDGKQGHQSEAQDEAQ